MPDAIGSVWHSEAIFTSKLLRFKALSARNRTDATVGAGAGAGTGHGSGHYTVKLNGPWLRWRATMIAVVLLSNLFCQPLVFAQMPQQAVPESAQRSQADGVLSSSAVADPSSVLQKPRWEVGVGAGYFKGFDYPASSDANERALAVPFFIYRSPLLRFGDGGVRAVAIEKPRLKLDLSIGGSLNASSQGNSAREGMPDLDFLFELGPQLEVRLFDRRLASGARLRARFTSELRAVFSTDFKALESRGWVADVGVGVNVANIAGTEFSFISGLDVSFATEPLHDYFYQVDDEFVTDERSLFDARGGYLETTLFTGLAFRALPQVRIFTGLIQGFYEGARNQDSPLFDTTLQTRYALGIVWTIRASEQMIDVVDLGSRN